MKRCPTCDKTFEDSMRFCQVDGTSLVDDAPAFDPYATIVGAPMVVPESTPAEDVPEPVIHETVGSKPIAAPEDVLDLPEADPLKTMYVSDAEMLAALGRDKPAPEPEIVEIQPIEEPPAEEAIVEEPPAKEPEAEVLPTPEPPSFKVPDVPAPSFQDFGPPPSPFGSSGGADEKPVPAPPIFDAPKPPPPALFNEADTMIQSKFSSPFDAAPPPPPEPITPKFEPPPPEPLIPKFEPPPEKASEPVAAWTPPPALDLGKSPFDPQPAAPVAAWTPPPAPEPSRPNKDVAANTPVHPPPAVGDGGQSKGMAIGALVAGILSCLCCPITPPVAIVMGFLARKKADENPSQYGGKGLALVGMITGVLAIIGQLIVGILWLTGALDSIITSIVREF